MSFVQFARKTIPLQSYSEVKFNPAGPYLPGMLIQFKVGDDWYRFKVEANVKKPGGFNARGKYWHIGREENIYSSSSFCFTDYTRITLISRD